MKAVEFAPTPAFSSYLVAFAVGPFAVVDGGHAGKNRIPVRFIVPKGHESRTAYAVQTTVETIERLESYFGTPYPFPKSDSISRHAQWQAER